MSLHSANNLLKQRLKFCQQCSNKSFNPSTGIVCGLTQNKPNFEEECLDYKSENNDLEKAILTIPCPDCNNACSPKDVHCKKCGYKLTGEKVAISFADNILKVGEWIKYWQTYFQIILSPIKKTISIYEQGTQSEALKFAEQGAAIYMLITFANITISDIGLLDGFIKSAIFVITAGSIFIVFQGFCSSASINDRTNAQILKMYCIMLGFVLPVEAAFGWLDNIYFPDADVDKG